MASMSLLALPDELLFMIFKMYCPPGRPIQLQPRSLRPFLLACRRIYRLLQPLANATSMILCRKSHLEGLATHILQFESVLYNGSNIKAGEPEMIGFLNITKLCFTYEATDVSPAACRAIKLLHLEELVVSQVDYLTPVGGLDTEMPSLRRICMNLFPGSRIVSFVVSLRVWPGPHRLHMQASTLCRVRNCRPTGRLAFAIVWISQAGGNICIDRRKGHFPDLSSRC